MIRIDPKAMDFAKSGLFAAIGSATDMDGNKIKIEVDDELLASVARKAISELVDAVFVEPVEIPEMK